MAHKFKLGVKLRDMVTGLTGITKSRVEYLNGCIQYSIQPPVGADGKYPDSYWFDQDQLVLVDNGISVQKNDNGGPESKAHDYNG
jgi:hypothetical protein